MDTTLLQLLAHIQTVEAALIAVTQERDDLAERVKALEAPDRTEPQMEIEHE